MNGSLKIGEVSGIPIKLHFTLIVIIALITWSIGANLEGFANWLGIEVVISPGLQSYALGAIMASGLFFSVFIHEMAHSIIAQRMGIKVEEISLWILGGIANIGEIPKDPDSEIRMSVAGPLASLGIGVVSLGIGLISPPTPSLVLVYLGVLNFILAGFNLIPAFPMDGGRILRALFAKREDYVSATQKAATIGKGFAILIAIVGFFYNFFLVIIGIFIYLGTGQEAFRTSQEAEGERIETLLKKVEAKKVMSKPVETVPPDLTVREFLENAMEIQHTGFPVVENEEVIGIITLEDTKKIDEERIDQTQIKEVMEKNVMYFGPEDTLDKIWKKMGEEDVGRFPIISRDGELVGMITRSDIMRAFKRLTELDSLREKI
ncbi:hypothetical protein AKJ56_01710 [candidate division MSBL1 archaeon SCGC-AAA382N08]|uniref:Zinc metalloprotease n=1 Tax=candidate division MSBL1 archaeon SCGC-AAA382N08 TaxID=1698285 RepID=A0A133VP08_9EURY|nr:hypothetical protein AKJ56_01710 [candidate division MSBL1 archaeon SCGC-AAA382N08]